MPFEIVRNDIVNMQVDAIVNTANPRPVVGAGTDAGIHAKAGPALLEARKKIGDIPVGCSAITAGYGLDSNYVIHTVGPIWQGGGYGEEKQLRSCYDSALKLALEQGCQSIAFPLISTGNYGFPKNKALQIALSACSEFLMEQEMQIYLVVWGKDTVQLSEKLFCRVASYIDEHYVAEKELQEYGEDASRAYKPAVRQQSAYRRRMERDVEEACVFCAPMSVADTKALSLEEMLKQEDAGFSETLLRLIDERGKKDSEVYKKAYLSKQHFSKIRNNPDYRPTKPTAIALALALELDMEQTKDLIGRAGYTLTNSSKFDLIIRFFIEQGNYNLMDINLVLHDFDQSLLGGL